MALVPPGYEDEPPARAHLVVEVAEGSLSRDRGIKADLYAEAGIPEYWIVNVPERVVEVYRAPHGGAYRERVVRRSGEDVTVTAFPGYPHRGDRDFLGNPVTPGAHARAMPRGALLDDLAARTVSRELTRARTTLAA